MNDELTLQCCDSDYREVERYLRQILFQWKYFPGDMIVSPYYGVRKLINTTSIGIEIKEQSIGNSEGGISSHKYVKQIIDEASLEVFHKELITYRKEETKIKFEKIAKAIGDILPVKLVGFETRYIFPR